MTTKILFDIQKAKQLTTKGRRANWWQRKGTPAKNFQYFNAKGQKIADDTAISRIQSLVIPPAWRFVRISPAASSKLQAVGVDTTGRTQYLYHHKFAESQQRKKFAKIEKFGEYVPQLRKITNEHISLDGFPREKILAVMIRLINSLYIRMGTENSVKRYKTFGITTLQNRHLEIRPKGELIFEFVGKSSVKHRKVLVDEELASLLKEIKTLGGSRKLFHYTNGDEKPRSVKPNDVNQYIKSITAPEFTAKDFRTWGATLLAAIKLAAIGKTENESQLKKNVNRAVKSVSEQLGNTPTVCRGAYIHPVVLKAYSEGVTLDEFRPRRHRRALRIESELEPEEQSLLKLFERWRSVIK